MSKRTSKRTKRPTGSDDPPKPSPGDLGTAAAAARPGRAVPLRGRPSTGRSPAPDAAGPALRADGAMCPAQPDRRTAVTYHRAAFPTDRAERRGAALTTTVTVTDGSLR
jgi:hypothetical protein